MLLALAQRRGQTPEAVIDALVVCEIGKDESSKKDEEIPSSGRIDSTLALFAQWAEEDKTDDPEDIARRQNEGDELLASLQENRLSLRRVDISGEE